MIRREYFVVIKNISTDNVTSIEARCDTRENAELFMRENEYLINDMNKSFKQPMYRYAIQEVVVMKETN